MIMSNYDKEDICWARTQVNTVMDVLNTRNELCTLHDESEYCVFDDTMPFNKSHK